MASIVRAVPGSKAAAAFLNQMLPQSWANCAFSSSWGNHGGGSPAFSVRFLNAVTCYLVGALDPGTVTGGTQIGTLPDSSFCPLTPQAVDGAVVAGPGAGQPFKVIVQPTGAIQLTTAALSGATEVFVNGAYALDL